MKIKCYIWRLTVCLFYFLTSCEEGGKYEKTFSEREVQVIDSIVYANRCIDSLRVLATRFAQDGNTFGEIVAYNELGKKPEQRVMNKTIGSINSDGQTIA